MFSSNRRLMLIVLVVILVMTGVGIKRYRDLKQEQSKMKDYFTFLYSTEVAAGFKKVYAKNQIRIQEECLPGNTSISRDSKIKLLDIKPRSLGGYTVRFYFPDSFTNFCDAWIYDIELNDFQLRDVAVRSQEPEAFNKVKKNLQFYTRDNELVL